MADDKIIVSRIQNRRGLKQDLPQPLRPGELGFATDSRQLYIGGDPANPNSADYNAVSYFENTINSRDHTISIANNQLIAFTVPFVKYVRGEFNGVTTIKQWQPSDARSIMSSATSPECTYSSSDYPVFSDNVTSTVSTTVVSSTLNDTEVTVNSVGSDPTGNIRVGDTVTGDDITGSVTVNSVTNNSGAGTYTVTLSSAVSFNANSSISFTPNSIKNFDTGLAFVSSDVQVHKNGIKLTPEANSALLTRPTAAYDYVIDASDVSANGIHSFTLRTRPDSREEVTVCYYDETSVVQAIEGVIRPTIDDPQGTQARYISPASSIECFYTAYDVPDYRRIPVENIKLSTTTGLGFIGLQQKHITCVAEGANIATPNNLTLGNLLISRNDQVYSASNVSVVSGNTDQYTITVSSAATDILSNIADTGVYRYNRVAVTSTNNQSAYLHNNCFDLLEVNTGNITIKIPEKEFGVLRDCTANLASVARYPNNDYTDNTANVISQTYITLVGNSEGVKVDDYVRVIDPVGTSTLHDTVFKVIRVVDGAIDVSNTQVWSSNVSAEFTQSYADLKYVNHKQDPNVTVQVYSYNNLLTSEVSNITVNVSSSNVGIDAGNVYSIDTANITDNTFIIDTVSNTISASDMDIVGTFYPVLASTYNNMQVKPVLAVDLSATSTLREAVTIINKQLVEVKSGSPVQRILPTVDYVPQDNGDLNAIFLSQDPAYTSVAVGGLEFSLYEDHGTTTLLPLGLTQGEYTRSNNTVKAKLERWLNDIVVNRDCNLFTNVFTGGDTYADSVSNLNPNGRQYNLVIDDTFGELTFCNREEAANFNYVVNGAYSESLFDRAEDDQQGTRGIVNLKNNIEIQTREAATQGQKTLTYLSMESKLILTSDDPGDEVFSLDASRYNNYIIDYSITDNDDPSNKYTRVGTMYVTARPEMTDTANAVVMSDRYNSTWENTVSSSVTDIVEPQFQAELIGDTIVFSMREQFADPNNPVLGDTVAHSINATLKLKYVISRWSGTD